MQVPALVTMSTMVSRVRQSFFSFRRGFLATELRQTTVRACTQAASSIDWPGVHPFAGSSASANHAFRRSMPMAQ